MARRTRAQMVVPRQNRLGFTWAELLVVIAIIAILISLLLPLLGGARASVRIVQCESNVRRLCAGLTAYAGDNAGKYPPNADGPSPGVYWYDPERAGQYVGAQLVSGTSKIGGSLLTCPDDPDSQRSYAMNIWASGTVDSYVLGLPPRGVLWGLRVAQPSRMILIAESWSAFTPDGSRWFSGATIGFAGRSASQRFGALGGLPPIDEGRWGLVNCELPFMRHRGRSAPDSGTAPHGRVVIGFSDGHVALLSDGDLVIPATGRATGQALWSPFDARN